jgi:hypothetical protein
MIESATALQSGALIELVMGAVFIAVFAYRRFNKPVNTDTATLALMYARDAGRTSTTRGRFVVAYVVYLACLLVIYYVISSDPKWLDLLYKKSNIGAEWKFSVPLMAALALTTLMPAAPYLSNVESELRGFLQRLGSIPVIVNETVSDLGTWALPIQKLDKSVLEAVLREHGVPLIDPQPRSHLDEYYQCAFLLHRLADWKSHRAFRRYVREFADVKAYIDARFEELTAAVGDDESLTRDSAPQTTRRERKSLRKQAIHVKQSIYEYIARGLLWSGIGDEQRTSQLKRLGFSPQPADGTVHRAVLLFLVIWAILVCSFLVMAPWVGTYTVGTLLFKCTTITTYFVVAACCAVAVRRANIESGVVLRQQSTPGRPYAEIVWRGALAILLCTVLSITFKIARWGTVTAALFDYTLSYPYQSIAFLVAGACAWCVHAPPGEKIAGLGAPRLHAVIGFLVGSVAGSFVWKWLTELRANAGSAQVRWGIARPDGPYSPDAPPSLVALLLMCAVVCAVICYYVPIWFREHVTRVSEPFVSQAKPVQGAAADVV